GKISNYVGRKNVVVFSYLTIGIMDIAIAFTNSVYVFIFILLLLGVSIFLSYPALFSFISEITNENVEGKNFGVIFTLQLGGGTILLIIGGALSDAIGVWMPFILLGGLSSLFSVILLVFYKKPFITNISV
ncbi:MAG: MFS transporter, partial [Candidatus Thermoplasmatota archaeon]|nr:MFS transporter [Candidatus Thermoplasmatota archaeon]